MKNIFCRFLLAVAIGFVALLSDSNSLEAQTRFAVPDTAIDLSKYKTVEECMALRSRLNRREIRRLPYWKDTLESAESEKRTSYPAPVRDTLTLCVKKFSPENVDYNNFTEYLDWVTVFYDVARDNDAQTVIDKKISTSTWAQDDSAGLQKVISGLLGAIGSSRALRWDTFVDVAKMIDSADVNLSWRTKMQVYHSLLSLGEEFGDTAVQRYAANKAIALEKTLTPKDKMDRGWLVSGRYTALNALDFIYKAEMLDSLRVGSKAYVAFRNSYWKNIRGENSDNLPHDVGEIAKPVTGDFWFKRDGDEIVRLSKMQGALPEEGKVNLVVFLDINCTDVTPTFMGIYHRSYPGGGCLASYSLIKRMAERYPFMPITIVSLTDGFIGNSEPMSPEDEAVQKSQWWLGTHKLPATLAVSEQSFFKLPEPDGRRVDSPHDNSLNYLFNKPRLTRVASGMAFLIDVDGTVLFGDGLNTNSEQKFYDLLKVIVDRK